MPAPVMAGANPADFTVADEACSDDALQPGESCTVEIAFAPRERGERAAAVEFPTEDVLTIELSGTGLDEDPFRTVTPDAVDFGDVPTGETSEPQTFVVRNNEVSATDPLAVRLDGADPEAFEVVSGGCAGTRLAHTEECQLRVRFEPNERREQTATLEVRAAPFRVRRAALRGGP